MSGGTLFDDLDATTLRESVELANEIISIRKQFKVIEDINEHTNLLLLNLTVEASRDAHAAHGLQAASSKLAAITSRANSQYDNLSTYINRIEQKAFGIIAANEKIKAGQRLHTSLWLCTSMMSFLCFLAASVPRLNEPLKKMLSRPVPFSIDFPWLAAHAAALHKDSVLNAITYGQMLNGVVLVFMLAAWFVAMWFGLAHGSISGRRNFANNVFKILTGFFVGHFGRWS